MRRSRKGSRNAARWAQLRRSRSAPRKITDTVAGMQWRAFAKRYNIQPA